MTSIRGYGGGGKGGGGGSRTPVEDKDNLRSRAYARVIDLISEGEIEGLATGDLKSVFLDKTPVLNSDGSSNFSGVTIATRNGTQAQTYIPGFPAVESEIGVSAQVRESTPVVRTVTGPGIDAVRVTIGIPALSRTDTGTGDVSGASVTFAIEVQTGGGAWVRKVLDTVRGKTTTRYQRSYVIKMDGTGPWNIRVVRGSDDSTTQYLQNDTWWDSYTLITNSKLRYPNSALAALIVDSTQFASIPARAYDMKMLRIKIPTNATVRADGSLTYSGTWDGTFRIAWCANPAWVFYDLLTTGRYGLGDYIDASQIDKWALYQIGRYCDELVPNGFGGTEPRFTCNLYLQSQEEAFKVMKDLASVFRGMIYWASGQITAVQDAPADAVALFTKANVIGGKFTYQGSSLKTRHTVALVQWNDPKDFYALKPEYVEDAAGIEKYGVQQTSVAAVGCTSQGQAHRVGKWLLYSENYETETVTFSTGIEGAVARPGSIIKVQDADRAGTRLSGRILAGSRAQLTLDRAVSVTAGATYTAYVMMPDGTVGQAAVSSISGSTVNLSVPLPFAPQANAVWMLNSSVVNLQTFRVVSVMDTGEGTYELTGLKHNPQKYDFIERDVVLVESPVSLLNTPPDAPTNINISEALYQTGTSVKVLVQLGWDQMERADYYVVTYRRDDGATITQNTRSTLFEVRDADAGFYEFTIVAVGINGIRSRASAASKQIYGKTAPPGDVQGFSIVSVSDGIAHLTWQRTADLDVVMSGYVRIRYSPEPTGALWENAVDIGPALPGTATLSNVPLLNGSYLAKFVDSSGVASVNAASVTTTVANLINMNVVAVINESPFTGTFNNTYLRTDLTGTGVAISATRLVSTLPLISTLPSIAGFGEADSYGEYLFANTFDLGGSYNSQLTASMAVQGIDLKDTIAQRGLVSTWQSVTGNYVDDVNAELYVRTTNDNPSGSPTWTEWQRFFVGQYSARAFQFKLVLTSDNPDHNIVVTDCSVTIDMPDRVEAERSLTAGAGAYAVTFPAAFKVTPSIAITAHSMQSGDYYTVTSQSPTGFTITFRNSAGTAISRTFDYMAKGYGYRQ